MHRSPGITFWGASAIDGAWLVTGECGASGGCHKGQVGLLLTHEGPGMAFTIGSSRWGTFLCPMLPTHAFPVQSSGRPQVKWHNLTWRCDAYVIAILGVRQQNVFHPRATQKSTKSPSMCRRHCSPYCSQPPPQNPQSCVHVWADMGDFYNFMGPSLAIALINALMIISSVRLTCMQSFSGIQKNKSDLQVGSCDARFLGFISFK